MKLNVQKRIAASILNCSQKRVWLDDSRAEDIKGAITRADIRALISKGLIQEKLPNITSKHHAREIAMQKSKGRRKGKGTRKGISTSRLPHKRAWINRVRIQRELIRLMKDHGLLTTKNYRKLYLLIKGGFFRSVRHVKLFIEEHSMVSKKQGQAKEQKKQ